MTDTTTPELKPEEIGALKCAMANADIQRRAGDIIAALADHQSAPVAPSDDTPDKFIAKALRLAGCTSPHLFKPAHFARIRRFETHNCYDILAHADTLHKLAEVEAAFKATAEAAAFHCKAAMDAKAKLAVAREALKAIQIEAKREGSLDHHLRRCAIVQTGKALGEIGEAKRADR